MPKKKKDKRKRRKIGKNNALSSDEDDLDSASGDSSNWDINFEAGEEVIKDYSGKATDLMEELTNRRSSIRLQALKKLAKLFKISLLQNFVFEKRETLIQYLRHCIRKGEDQEVCMACRVFTLLVVTLGVELGNMHSSIWTPFEAYIRNSSKTITSRTAVTELFGLVCFTGDQEDEEALQSMDLLVQIWKQGLSKGGNEGLITQALESWRLICTVAPKAMVEKQMQTCLPSLVQLLDHKLLEVRRIAGETLALGFSCFLEDPRQNKGDHIDPNIDMSTVDWSLHQTSENHSDILPSSSDTHSDLYLSVVSQPDSQDLDMDLLISKVEQLAKDGNRRRSKKERAKQRLVFRDILRTFEQEEEPSESLQIGKDRFEFNGWVQIIQLSAFRRCLDVGLQFHLKKNEFLTSVFDLTFEPIEDLNDDDREKRVRHLENKNRARMQDMHIAKQRKKKLALRNQHIDIWA